MYSSNLSLPSFVTGIVVSGFGRGSKELGCPTANLSSHVVSSAIDKLDTGVYYGYAVILPPDRGNERDKFSPSETLTIHGMVSSLGYNPHFGNDTKSLEVHILHSFESDFYGATLRVVLIDKIRDEKKFESLKDLIQAIEDDKDFSRSILEINHEEYEGIRRQLLSHDHFDHEVLRLEGNQSSLQFDKTTDN